MDLTQTQEDFVLWSKKVRMTDGERLIAPLIFLSDEELQVMIDFMRERYEANNLPTWVEWNLQVGKLLEKAAKRRRASEEQPE